MNAEPSSVSVFSGRDRRLCARFPTSFRAGHVVAGQWSIAPITNLSHGGLLLARADDPSSLGERIELFLQVDDASRLISLAGTVVGASSAGTHVAFLPGQPWVQLAVRNVLEVHVIPGLERRLGTSDDDAAIARLLSQWYREIGRTDLAIALLRGAVDATPTDPSLFVDLVGALTRAAAEHAANGDVSAADLLAEARDVAGRGLGLAPDRALDSIGMALRGLERGLTEEPFVVSNGTSEVERLRHSVQRDREALYQGFSRLLRDRKRLRELEGAGDNTGDRAHLGRMQQLIDSIHSELEGMATLHPPGAAEPAADLFSSPPEVSTQTATSEVIPPTMWPQRLVELSLVAVVGFLALFVGSVAIENWVSRQSMEQKVSEPRPPEAPKPEEAVEPKPDEPLPIDGVSELEQPNQGSPPEDAEVAPRATTPVEGEPSDVPEDASAGEVAPNEAAPDESTITPTETAAEEAAVGDVSVDAEFTADETELPKPVDSDLSVEEPTADEPFDPAVLHLGLARQYLEERKVLLAVEELEECLTIDPERPEAHGLLGSAYLMLGREEAALAAYDRFLFLVPNHRHADQVRQVVTALRWRLR